MTDTTRQQTEETERADGEREKLYVVHMIWFNKPDGPHKYQQYLESANKIAQKYGARRVDALIPVETVQGDVEPDYLFVVEWPNDEQFQAFIQDPGYRATAELRQGACAKRVLLKCHRPSHWAKTPKG